MLKQFLYLDTAQLEQYLSALEDGARVSVESHDATTRDKAGSGSVGLGGTKVKGGASRSEEVSQTTVRADTAQARYERLEKLATADPESSGWHRVLEPDAHLNSVVAGDIIDVDCELYVPQAIKFMSKSGGFSDTVDAMLSVLPAAKSLNLDTEGLPDGSELAAMAKVAKSFATNLVAVGDLDESSWHLYGRLRDEFLAGDVEGLVRIVGKVVRQVPGGKHVPLLALPGLDLLPREQRREMERLGPGSEDDDTWLSGPALMLEILAIYR